MGHKNTGGFAMHPIVILFLLFAALGAGYYLWATKSAAVVEPLNSLRAQHGISNGMVIQLVIGIVALYILYQIYALIRTAHQNRQANQRMRDRMEAP
jgi:NADH:ubiquinone oxidoreductase subunit 2 (subunit N)